MAKDTIFFFRRIRLAEFDTPVTVRRRLDYHCPHHALEERVYELEQQQEAADE